MRIIPILLLVIAMWATAGCEKKTDTSLDLLEASSHGNLAEVQTLLDKGADINAKDKNGITALMLASSDGYRDIVKLLLARGADINAKNNNGETALAISSDKEVKALLREHGQPITPADLFYAARIGDLDAVKSYLDKGIDVNAKGKEGLTALIEASQEGKKETIELLLSKGADINAKTDYGLTALIGASQEGRQDVVQLLLTKGAEVKIKNQYGESALSVASKMGHKDVVELLRQYSSAQNELPMEKQSHVHQHQTE